VRPRIFLTYDGTTETLKLYSADVTMDLDAMATPPQITVSYSPNLAASLFIGMCNPAGYAELRRFGPSRGGSRRLQSTKKRWALQPLKITVSPASSTNEADSFNPNR
jgi:hypothetical protein